MDDSPIPRCNFKYVLMTFCLALALIMLVQVNILAYGKNDENAYLAFTPLYECEDIGITDYIGITIPICCCAFFALKKRKRSDIPSFSPPACRQYAKILNC